MKPHLQCAEQQVSRSKLTKYCACHPKRLTFWVLITYETSFTMRGATGVTIQPHQILRLSCRKTHILSRHHIWNLISIARSNRCHDPTSPNTAPATQKLHCKISDKIFENRWNVISNAGTIREWSENDPTMIREWSDHENANRNPPRKWGCFSSSPGAFSIVKYNNSSPILHSNIHQVLRLPQKVTIDLHQILPLPRKVTLELHQILPLPRKVTLELHQVLRLPQKVTLDLHQILPLPRKVTLELHQILPLPRKVTLDLHQILPLPRKVTLELHQILPLPRKVTHELPWGSGIDPNQYQPYFFYWYWFGPFLLIFSIGVEKSHFHQKYWFFLLIPILIFHIDLEGVFWPFLLTECMF